MQKICLSECCSIELVIIVEIIKVVLRCGALCAVLLLRLLLLPALRLLAEFRLAEDLEERWAVEQVHLLEGIVDLSQDAAELCRLNVRLDHI